ncbi:hypothetical protein D3C73_1514730 [compost metagenome]
MLPRGRRGTVPHRVYDHRQDQEHIEIDRQPGGLHQHVEDKSDKEHHDTKQNGQPNYGDESHPFSTSFFLL